MAMAKIRDTFQRPPSGWKVTDPITGVQFSSNSYRNLRGKIFTHRENNNLSVDGIDEFIAEQICEKNELFFCQDWPTRGPSLIIKKEGAGLWAELHKRALAHNGEQDWVWLNQWTERIPSYGCACKSNWKNLMKQYPPQWNDYFFWSVTMHSKVSESIGKMSLTVQQARQIWDK